MLAITVGVLLPNLIFSLTEKWFLSKQSPPDNTTAVTAESVPSTQAQEKEQPTVTVLMPDGGMRQMQMDDYITGVVLGEMPVEFDAEALKAQAVVARTYTYKRSTTGQKHSGGAVCTDFACCQGYCSVEEYLQQGGTKASVSKVSSAVSSTSGQILTYQGAVIEATYFSCSGGRTEDALAVWGSYIPYLQAVDSPGEEAAVHYTDTVWFTKNEFADCLGINPKGAPNTWFGNVTYTDGGGVATMEIAGTKFQGTQLRQKLNLRSTVFTVKTVGNDICITTKGFGHRVGMSQYGAEAMAVSGSSYEQILAHYYPGTELKTHTQN